MDLSVSSRLKYVWISGAVLVVVCVVAADFLFWQYQREHTTPPFTFPVAETTDVQPVADFKAPVVGDTLGAMTVVSVAPFNTGQFSSAPDLMQLGPENISIVLKGPIEITGEAGPVHSAIGFDGYCMSVTDPISLSRMPRLDGTARTNFCFRHPEVVEQMLGHESKTVTVKIDNYELESYPSEVLDWADLVSLVTE